MAKFASNPSDEHLNKPIDYVLLYDDSHRAIFNSQNPVTQKGIKHIKIQYHYIQEQVELETIKIFYVPTKDNIADIFTKNFSPLDFLHHQAKLGLEFYPLKKKDE